MSHYPTLTLSDIHRWLGHEPKRERRSEALEGRLGALRRSGMQLNALFYRQTAPPYGIEIRLDAQGVVGGECTCPIGIGARCPHAAALLYAWQEQPEAFVVVPSPDEILAERERAELLTLIHQMMARYPDLELLLRLPPVGRDEKKGQTLWIQHQIREMVASCPPTAWQASAIIARQLDHLLTLGERYGQQDQLEYAVAIYEGIAREVLAVYGQFEDEVGDFHGIVNECVEGLGGCLMKSSKATQRRKILFALFEIYRWDVTVGEGKTEMGYQVPPLLLREATEDEKAFLVAWLQEAADRQESRWGIRMLDSLALTLQAELLPPDAFLQRCREQGFYVKLIERLLRLGQVEEAMLEAQQLDDERLVPVAKWFIHYGHPTLANQLTEPRAATSQSITLLEWLKQQATENHQNDKIRKYSEQLFWLQPCLSRYNALKESALSTTQWEPLHSRLIQRLEANNQLGLLMEIYLSEQKLDQALDTLSQMSGGFRWWGEQNSLDIAHHAEKTRPRQAIHLYLSKVHHLIEAGSPENYTTAANLLLRIRTLYTTLHEQLRWQLLHQHIRQHYIHVQGFREALGRVGL